MKFIVLFFPLLFIAGCKKETPLLFEMPFQNLDFTMPAGQNALETYYVNFPAVPTNITALLDNFKIEANEVSGIVPGNGRLFPIFGAGDFDDLFREFVVQICPTGSTDNKCGFEGFYWDLVGQKIGLELNLIPNPLDLSDLLMEDKVHIQVWYRLLRASNETIDTRLALSFLVQ
ncbi:MAG: hypothetical protein KDC34_08225 [Saprospiraceae bacterium]|nr:hypothetical protein [Saprospiraceae bacterium]